MQTSKSFPDRMNRKQVSEYLLAEHGIVRTPGSLGVAAHRGTGPKFRRFGSRHVYYDRCEVDAWVSENLSEPFRATGELA